VRQSCARGSQWSNTGDKHDPQRSSEINLWRRRRFRLVTPLRLAASRPVSRSEASLDQEVGARICPQLRTKPGGTGKDERLSRRTFGRMDTLGLDTIAGAKLLKLKFGSAGA